MTPFTNEKNHQERKGKGTHLIADKTQSKNHVSALISFISLPHSFVALLGSTRVNLTKVFLKIFQVGAGMLLFQMNGKEPLH